MKKSIILAAILLLIGFQAKAQVIGGAGYLYSSEKTSGVDGTTPYHGAFVGASYNIALGSGFGVAPGLYASVLLHNVRAEAGSSKVGYNVAGSNREVALNVPVRANYSLDFGHDKSLLIYAGPIFQVGLLNTTTVTGSVSFLGLNYSDGDQVNNYDPKNGTVNRFNIYLGGGVGIQLGDFIIHVGYDHSLLDVDKLDNYVTSRGLLKIGFGLAF